MSSFITGQIIEARCSRCRDVTGHVVMACLDGMPIKVECRACGSVHKYTAPGAAPRRKVETTVRVKAGHARAEAVDATVKAEKAIERMAEMAAEKKAAEKRVAELEQKVEKLDARQQELMAKLAEPPGADFGDLMRESAIVQDKLDAATALWEEAMEKLEEILAANAAIHED